MKTLYLGPDELLVAAKLAFSADLPLDVVSAPHRRHRSTYPHRCASRASDLDPDVDRHASADAPATEAIVLTSED
ncbi:MAG TPA: hypothetical protein VGO88_09105 [Mycetocola sp.]|jgi:hypothetical protein|nr:hypothetical protein [Mycetocola sp.]